MNVDRGNIVKTYASIIFDNAQDRDTALYDSITRVDEPARTYMRSKLISHSIGRLNGCEFIQDVCAGR